MLEEKKLISQRVVIYIDYHKILYNIKTISEAMVIYMLIQTIWSNNCFIDSRNSFEFSFHRSIVNGRHV